MATRLFEKDKVAYVFDSSAAVSRSLAVQTRLQLEGAVTRIQPILENFDLSKREFSNVAIELFNRQKEVSNLFIIMPDEANGYKFVGQLHHQDQPLGTLTPDQMGVVAQAFKNGAALKLLNSNGEFLYARKINETDPMVFVSVYTCVELASSFSEAGLYKSFLIDPSGEIVLGPPADVRENLFQGQPSPIIFSSALSGLTPEGTGEVSVGKNETLLLSYSKLPIGNFTVGALMNKQQALSAVSILVTKSILFFIALLAITVIISLFASVQLTSALRQLFEATQKVAQGKFDIRLKSNSNDEVGGLAKSFNLMAKEVSRLMSETAEKARMASELETVRMVQETLFPEPHKIIGNFEIIGHFEPASECGGDWWNYSIIDQKLYCWIGDATGHGAPAALITGAARSAASIIEMIPEMTPAKALYIMNRAIGETSKGKILMTFFICCIDLKTGMMTYSSASHDPPFIVRAPEGEKITKKHLIPLIEGRGVRLGDKMEEPYKNVEFQLEPGDALMMYTDGIIDLKNPKGETWGERTFLKSLMSCASKTEESVGRMNDLKKQITEFRRDAALIDDITLVLCQYRRST